MRCRDGARATSTRKWGCRASWLTWLGESYGQQSHRCRRNEEIRVLRCHENVGALTGRINGEHAIDRCDSRGGLVASERRVRSSREVRRIDVD